MYPHVFTGERQFVNGREVLYVVDHDLQQTRFSSAVPEPAPPDLWGEADALAQRTAPATATPPRRFAWHDLDTGDVSPMPVTPDLVRALTYRGRHDQIWTRRIWLVEGWDARSNRPRPHGLLVTTLRSDKPGCRRAQPKPIAYVRGVGRRSLALAQLIDQDRAAARVIKHCWPDLAAHVMECSDSRAATRLAGMLLHPLRANGSRIKSRTQQFPAAMLQDWGRGRLGFKRLTHAELAHLIAQKKSGASEAPHAVKPASNGSGEKAEATAA